MKARIIIFMLLSVGIATVGFCQKDNKFVRQGNKEFEKENYNEAETDYLKALSTNPASTKASYNLAATKYRQDNPEEAIKNWTSTALNPTNDAEVREQSFYNIGNAMMKSEKYKESIEAYKQALRLNPNDEEARYNLEYARKKLQQQQQQQQDQQGGGGNNDQNKDQQQNQDQQQQQQQDQQQQQNQQNQQDQQQQQQQGQQQHQEISKEEAERMLEAMKNNEKKTLDKVKQEQVGKPQKTDKDW